MPTKRIIAEFNLALMEETYANDFGQAILEGYKSKYDEVYKRSCKEIWLNKSSMKIEIKKVEILRLTVVDLRLEYGGAYYDDISFCVSTLPSKFLSNLGFIEGLQAL